MEGDSSDEEEDGSGSLEGDRSGEEEDGPGSLEGDRSDEEEEEEDGSGNVEGDRSDEEEEEEEDGSGNVEGDSSDEEDGCVRLDEGGSKKTKGDGASNDALGMAGDGSSDTRGATQTVMVEKLWHSARRTRRLSSSLPRILRPDLMMFFRGGGRRRCVFIF